MTTRTTLRLGGLTAALVVSLALVSSASAGPIGLGYHKAGLGSDGSKTLIVSTRTAQRGPWMEHKAMRGSLTVVAPKGPADRVSPTGAPSVPVTVVEQVASSGFSWTDAAMGVLFGVALALIAVYATITLRGRGGGVALRT